jgi:hypothetical protein
MRRSIRCIITVVVATSAGPSLAAAQPPYPKPEEEPVQRRESHLGVGIGYAGTSSVVGEVFGGGTDALMYVNQRLYRPLGVRASFGSVYLGSTKPAAERETYLTGLDFFGASFADFTMKYTYLSIGPSFQLHFGERHGFLASASYVLYDVILDLTSLTASQHQVKDSHWGVNADLMYTIWIGASWGFNAQLQWHWIDTSTRKDDLYYAFVRGDADPQFVSFLVGAQVGYK